MYSVTVLMHSMGSAMQVTISFATADQQIEYVQHLEEGATVREAIERSGTKAGNKGAEAATSALEMVSLLGELNN